MTSLIEDASEESEMVGTTPRLIIDKKVYDDLSKKLKDFIKLKNYKRGLFDKINRNSFKILFKIFLDTKKLEDEEVKEFLKLYPKAAQPSCNTFNTIPRFFTQVI